MLLAEAVKKIRDTNANKVIIECLEFPHFFAFALVDKGKDNELVAGGYHTVDKKTGAISVFNPTRNLKLFCEAKEININSL